MSWILLSVALWLLNAHVSNIVTAICEESEYKSWLIMLLGIFNGVGAFVINHWPTFL